MLSLTDRLQSVTHPLVASMHMKKEFDDRYKEKDVLVIETCFPDPDDDYTTFDSYLMDLLVDLQDLKNKAEQQVGAFDRVDIRAR